MACYQKEKTGSCCHRQCPYPNDSGYECVDIAEGFCEVGDGCVSLCPFSWKKEDTKKTERAEKAFKRKFPEL